MSADSNAAIREDIAQETMGSSSTKASGAEAADGLLVPKPATELMAMSSTDSKMSSAESKINYPDSKIKSPDANIKYPDSNIKYPDSNIKDPDSKGTYEVDSKIKYEEHQSNNDGEDSATESLPPNIGDELGGEEPHDRSDGSDSGLGLELCDDRAEEANIAAAATLGESDSETSFLDRINEPSTSCVLSVESKLDEFAILPNTLETVLPNILENDIGAILDEAKEPPKSSLKRKLIRAVDDQVDAPKCKKKRSITFDSVTVYYFPRTQGFTCVPSQGGSTLGMGNQHSHTKKFSISDHAVEQRRLHRQLLQQLRSKRHAADGSSGAVNGVELAATSSDDSESDDEPSDVSESELDLDNYYFLQPVPTRQRRALLRAAGVRKIDSLEKDECRDIRTSREFCGCGCKGYCDPDTCSCSQAGIKCQVDRLHFPCGCSRDNCGNSSGRIEFNPVRVRTHFIHTLMRLELEKKQKAEEDVGDAKWMENERLVAYNKEENGENVQQQFAPHKDVNLNGAATHESGESSGGRSSGSFTNLHYGAPGEGPGGVATPSHTAANLAANLPTREDSLDLYTFREDFYQDDNERLQSGGEQQRKQQQHFAPISGNFHFPAANSATSDTTRFPEVACFPAGANPYHAAASPNQYPHHHHHHHQHQAATTYQAFPDFHPPPVFNPYTLQSYTQEYPAKSHHLHHNNQHHQQPSEPSNNFSMHPPVAAAQNVVPFAAANFIEQNHFNETKENHYTSLNPVGANSKIESSFGDLLHNSRCYNNAYSHHQFSEENFGPVEQQQRMILNADDRANDDNNKCSNQSTAINAPGVVTTAECEVENFGEIIKQSMVETVST